MSPSVPIVRTIRNIRRYAEILEVLARYGFGDIVQELNLDRVVEKGLALVRRSTAPAHERLSRPARLRMAMEELGPTFIKMGQVLSTRPDLIPESWADEFKKLQDDVPALDYAVIRKSIEAEFPGRVHEVFKKIHEEPLAAASIAQVHRATLHDGTHVVIKVLRPGIHEVTTTDMEILGALASFAEAHFSNLGYSPTDVVREFSRELKKEVDLIHEGQSTERLAASFEDDSAVAFPRVYWEATTHNILTLEEFHGVLLSRLDVDRRHALSPEDRKSVVASGARAVLRMCLEIGFFHADPHPGNLFALPGGRIGFIDCGMTGQVDARTMQHLADLVSGVVSGDTDRVVGVVGALGDVEQSKLDDRAFRADVREFVARFENVPLDRLDMGDLLRDFFARLRAHHVRCPGDLVLLIKALTTIESVAKSLDPDFQLVEFARPYVEAIVGRRYSFSAVRRRLQSAALRYAELAEDLPLEVRALLTQVRRNRLAVNIEHRGLNRLTNTIEHASRNISFALVVAALLVGSSILVLADRGSATRSLTILGAVGFGVAAILTVSIVARGRGYVRDKDK